MRKLVAFFGLVVLVAYTLAAPVKHIWGKAGVKIQPSDEEEVSKLSSSNKPYADFCLESRDYVVSSIKAFDHPIITEAYEELFEMLDGSVDETTGKTHYATIHELTSMDRDTRAMVFNNLMKRNEYREIMGDLFKVCTSLFQYNQHLSHKFSQRKNSLALGDVELRLEDLKCKSTTRVTKAFELCLATDLKKRFMDFLEQSMREDLQL